MNAEDLFAAIGGVESSRLERSEMTVSSRTTFTEETDRNKKRHRKAFPKIVAAVLIAVMIPVTAVAAVGFLMFDDPVQMIGALFGNRTGTDNVQWTVPDNQGDPAAEYHADRVPVDENAAGALAPYAEAVSKSITFGENTLTVDANLYDAGTRCGFLTYSIENPNGIRKYAVQPDGEVWFPEGELLVSNLYGKSYIIREKCTDTTLCATYFYRNTDKTNDRLELRLSFFAATEDPEAALRGNGKDSGDSVVIGLKKNSVLPSAAFGDNAVALSPFSVRVDHGQPALGSYVRELKLIFRDGSEYTVKDDTTLNCLFEVTNNELTETTLMLNRIADVNDVVAVVVNGVRFEK
ncbi:MAG: hypothetical protein Q4C53_09640 [Clostridia bacterium]|nr:hypothetical protein [Clostridia bacterium]